MNTYQNSNNHQYDNKVKKKYHTFEKQYIQIKNGKREEKNKECKQNLDILFDRTALYWSKNIF
jgi:hypothetical protein